MKKNIDILNKDNNLKKDNSSNNGVLKSLEGVLKIFSASKSGLFKDISGVISKLIFSMVCSSFGWFSYMAISANDGDNLFVQQCEPLEVQEDVVNNKVFNKGSKRKITLNTEFEEGNDNPKIVKKGIRNKQRKLNKSVKNKPNSKIKRNNVKDEKPPNPKGGGSSSGGAVVNNNDGDVKAAARPFETKKLERKKRNKYKKPANIKRYPRSKYSKQSKDVRIFKKNKKSKNGNVENLKIEDNKIVKDNVANSDEDFLNNEPEKEEQDYYSNYNFNDDEENCEANEANNNEEDYETECLKYLEEFDYKNNDGKENQSKNLNNMGMNLSSKGKDSNDNVLKKGNGVANLKLSKVKEDINKTINNALDNIDRNDRRIFKKIEKLEKKLKTDVGKNLYKEEKLKNISNSSKSENKRNKKELETNDIVKNKDIKLNIRENLKDDVSKIKSENNINKKVKKIKDTKDKIKNKGIKLNNKNNVQDKVKDNTKKIRNKNKKIKGEKQKKPKLKFKLKYIKPEDRLNKSMDDILNTKSKRNKKSNKKNIDKLNFKEEDNVVIEEKQDRYSSAILVVQKNGNSVKWEVKNRHSSCVDNCDENVDLEGYISAINEEPSNLDKGKSVISNEKSNLDKDKNVISDEKSNLDKDRSVISDEKSNLDKDRSVISDEIKIEVLRIKLMF